MGLDMYLYRLSKPRPPVDTLNKMTYDTLTDKGYMVFVDGEEFPANFEAIKPYAKRVNIEARYINFEQIKKDFDIPDDAFIVGESYSNEEVGYTFHLPHDDSQHITIPYEEYEKKYIFPKRTDAWCIKAEHIAYWRKNYNLENAIYDACDTSIENCGFYPLNSDMWDVICRHDPSVYERIKEYRDKTSGCVCYHEWY